MAREAEAGAWTQPKLRWGWSRQYFEKYARVATGDNAGSAPKPGAVPSRLLKSGLLQMEQGNTHCTYNMKRCHDDLVLKR